jgi:hypothetical protein
MIAILAAASLIATYDCQLSAPKAVGFEGSSATASDIGLPASSLAFSASLESGNPIQAKLDWPGDPFTMAGKFPAIQTAPGAYAFSAFSSGPCLFTEQACLTQVNLVEGGNGTAKIIVTPVALATDKQANTRSPFVVVALGTCTARSAAK